MHHTTVSRAVAALAVLAGMSAPALAVAPGFVESFANAGNTGFWIGGASAGSIYANPGAGGVGGANDGFLSITNERLGNFGAYNPSSDYAGDWRAAGITGLSLWLRDINAINNFEIHISIGNGNVVGQNLWQYNIGFVPTADWQQFTVDLANINPANWTRIRGSGTLEDALRNADRLHFRNDRAPFTPSPGGGAAIIGDLGVDEIRLLPAPGAAAVMAFGAVAHGRRRR